jgi:hypothetical protein
LPLVEAMRPYTLELDKLDELSTRRLARRHRQREARAATRCVACNETDSVRCEACRQRREWNQFKKCGCCKHDFAPNESKFVVTVQRDQWRVKRVSSSSGSV